MTDSDSIKLAMLFLIAFWIYYLKITRSFSGRFIYFDKRKKMSHYACQFLAHQETRPILATLLFHLKSVYRILKIKIIIA